MGRKHKVVNKSGIPQYAIDRFARCVFDDMREDFMKPEVQADFQRWLAEREANKKKRAATTTVVAALVRYVALFRMGRPLRWYVCS